VGQILTAFKFDLSELEDLIAPSSNPVKRVIDKLAASVDNTVKSVERILLELRPQILDIMGLPAAIEWQAEEFLKQTGILCEVHNLTESCPIPKDRAILLFRIFQELLINAGRHSKASHVQVDFENQNDFLIMVVKDNGIGMNNEKIQDPKSLGILGIEERARLMDGQAFFCSAPGEGTTVTVKCPQIPMKEKQG